MIYLFLALLSSFSVALILRWVERRDLPRLVVIASNYATATLVAMCGPSWRSIAMPPDALFAGMGLGVMFLAGFMVFGLALRREGMAPAVTMGRISLIIPVLVAVAVFGESPSAIDVTALVLIIVVLWSWEGGKKRIAPVLLVLFALFGCISAMLKWFAAVHPHVPESRFLTVVFGAALVCGWIVVAVRRQRLSAFAVGIGFALGIPNYYSSFFLVKALERMPAFVVFPVVDTGVIVLSALAGTFWFSERLGKRRLVSVTLAVVALILLGISR